MVFIVRVSLSNIKSKVSLSLSLSLSLSGLAWPGSGLASAWLGRAVAGCSLCSIMFTVHIFAEMHKERAIFPRFSAVFLMKKKIGGAGGPKPLKGGAG